MSVAGYEAFVCVASLHIKPYVQPFIWLPWDARSRPYVCLYCAKKLLHKLYTKKYWNKNKKHLKKEKSRDAVAKKSRYKRSRDK